ncbi:GUN4 domain-containing protein [Nodosilinea sp. LEGE 07298]|uniref:GUN4 domain-containing protein n=1 Tax=Nodosilinea sp. LEGE 07298 TaxID=2777970 RepID=UPI0018806304|nr:GUN4 domain-containing protein [Nodosilinea sp. LEGE 07298]MBE9114022.1 GUN4 domain-containing protein [Nodosilinea sp. LEGE 07298]
MSFIFISYSRQDKAYVSLLAQALESHHLPFWLDINTDYGATWPHTIEKQVECCQVLIIVMSPRSKQSHWVQCELAHALELRKPIFPLRLEGPRWFSVAALQTVDVTGGKLPPARFFDTLRPHFPAPTPTSESLPLQDIVEESIPPAAPPVGWVLPEPSGWVLPNLPTAPLSQTPTSAVQDDDLSSEKGVDYRKLSDLLKAGHWKEADRETDRRMLEAVGRKEDDWIRGEEVLNFPCAVLKTINALWVDYSDGKWGFGVQKRVYQECGAKLDGNYPGHEIWHEFCRRVGWREEDSYVSDSDFTFDLQNSSVGKLPSSRGVRGSSSYGGVLRWNLFSRIKTCRL